MAVQHTQKPEMSQSDSHPDNQSPVSGWQSPQSNHPAASEAEPRTEYAEESPELLRWRADTLLDEMMLGGVDVSAGGANHSAPAESVEPTSDGSTFQSTQSSFQGNGSVDHSAAHTASSPAQSAATPNPWTEGDPFAAERPESPPGNQDWMGNSSANAHHSDFYSPDPAAPPTGDGSHQPDVNRGANHGTEAHNRPHPNGHAPSNGSQGDSHDGAATHAPAASDSLSQSEFVVAPFPSTYGNGGGYGNGTSGNGTSGNGRASGPGGATDGGAHEDETQHDLLRPPSAVHAHYPPAGEAAAGGAPASSTPPPPAGGQQPAAPINEPLNEPHAAPRPARMVDDYAANQAHLREQERRQWSIMTGRSNDYPSSVPRSDAPETAAWGGQPVNGAQAYEQSAAAYQNQSMPFADSMAVGPQARRRSNMLPRQTEPDMEMMRQDILSLQERVDTALPIGQDTLERAHHLIEKAQALLDFGPDRSAEISYYTQQVRSILQRAEQRLFWSNVYRRRLLTYLVGWVFLSMILLASSYLYAEEMRSFFVRMTNASPAGPMAQHFVPFLFTIAAGTLGSALGALVNMWRHSQKEYGFFDRKYGLLGIVLPLIGAFVGALIYLLVSLLLLLFRLEPASLGVFAIIPAFMAFLFGCSQEKIYGTSS